MITLTNVNILQECFQIRWKVNKNIPHFIAIQHIQTALTGYYCNNGIASFIIAFLWSLLSPEAAFPFVLHWCEYQHPLTNVHVQWVNVILCLWQESFSGTILRLCDGITMPELFGKVGERTVWSNNPWTGSAVIKVKRKSIADSASYKL